MIDVTIELGRGCAATSWVYINLVAHNWMLPYWPSGAADDIWGEDPEALIGSTLVFPAGRLAPAEAGIGSPGAGPMRAGWDSSDWMMLGAIGQGKGDAAPGPRIVLVRAADIEIIDTWHVSGLVGTGSKDVACRGPVPARPHGARHGAVAGGLPARDRGDERRLPPAACCR